VCRSHWRSAPRGLPSLPTRRSSDLPARLEGLKVVVDCAHGAAYRAAPEALRRLGADVMAVCAEPDGLNINRDCGSTHLDVVAARSAEHTSELQSRENLVCRLPLGKK